MDEKYMTKQTISYSDGTETTLFYNKNGQQEEIEQKVAEAVAGDHKTPEAEVVEEYPEEVSEEIGVEI